MTDPITSVTSVASPSAAGPGPAGIPAAAAAPIAEPSQPMGAQQKTPPDLHAVAAALNQHAQDLQTSLHFQVDKITGQMVISVVDTQNNQLLMQIPGQEALAIAQSLEPLQMQLMKQTA